MATLAPIGLVIAIATAAMVIAREVLGIPLAIPQRRWQVPREWLRHFWLGSLVFGAIMGVGVLTYTSSSIFYLYLVATLLSGSSMTGALIGAAYGACYSIAVFASTIAWLRIAPADQTLRAFRRGRSAALAGAAIAPLLVLLPVVWSSIAPL